MSRLKKYFLLALVIPALLLFALVACEVTPEQAESVVQTAESLSPLQVAALAATAEALPQEQADLLRQLAINAGVPTLSPTQASNVVSTVTAARATATAVGMAADEGERVNATQIPDTSPRIIYFYASSASKESMQTGIRYHLNWVTQNATRVEIFGTVMDNPEQGSWPIYNDSDDWVLWAANDNAWVESYIQVQPDRDTGSSLQNVTVNNRNIILTFRDPQFVDGDVVDVDVNGIRVIDYHITDGRSISFPVTLQGGANAVTVYAHYTGLTPPLVTEVAISNVTGGPAFQWTRGMNQGESQTFTITAP